MTTGRPIVRARIALLAFLLGSACGQAHAQLGGSPVLNPKEYASPSGKYVLFVDPSDKYGRGGATYRLSREGREVWAGTRPYSFWDASVTDEGIAAGYAYTHGRSGSSVAGPDAGLGDFRVVILDATGKERLDKATKREHSHYFHLPPDPLAAGLFVDEPNDRMVVRVCDADVNRQAEEWWSFRISDGRPLATVRPKDLSPDPGPISSLIDARPVPGTTLTLLHWWRYRFEEPDRLGVRFALIGLDGRPAWSLELPDDYSIPGNREAELAQLKRFQSTGAILRADQPGRFDLRFVKDNQRVTFAVARGPGGAWTVAEEARRPYVEPEPSGSK